jgi:hypothetical protein
VWFSIYRDGEMDQARVRMLDIQAFDFVVGSAPDCRTVIDPATNAWVEAGVVYEVVEQAKTATLSAMG